MKLAAAVERGTSHPIANAICRQADVMYTSKSLDNTSKNVEGKENGGDRRVEDVILNDVSGFVTSGGRGAKAIVSGRTVAVGKFDWVQSQIHLHHRDHSLQIAPPLLYKREIRS